MHYVIGRIPGPGAIARRETLNHAVDCLFHMALGASDGDYPGAIKACAYALGAMNDEPRVSASLLGWYIVENWDDEDFE
jgi:hypothetical protein